MKRFLCVLTAFLIVFLSLAADGLFAMPAFADENESADESAENTFSFSGNFAFPDTMRATNITIGYDFFKDINQAADITQAEITEIVSNMEKYGLNTIIINTSYNGIVYYEIDKKVFLSGSPLNMLIDEARRHNLFVYITFSLNDALASQELDSLQEKIDYLSQCVHKLTNKYLIDGILLTGYYASKTEESYSDYIENGSGIGYENWLKDNNGYLFRLVSDAIHSTNNTIPVGIDIENAWLNKRTDSRGSDTKDDFEALKDGFSDTKAYIENGYADFMVVTCYGGLNSVELKFKSIIEWWNKLAVEADIPMFISHANERISVSDSKWAADQILKQLEECAKYPGYSGSVFRSYESLKENKGTSTDALKKYFDGLIDTNSLYTELSMVLPKQTTFTTYEPTVVFQGSFDSNFDIFFDGEKILLNDAGNFYFELDLEVGENIHTFKNKAKTVTYKITRRVKVLQSVEPEEGTELRVEGKTKISVSTIAYSGSKVTATLNGQTITLIEDDIRSDELDSNTNYARFTGYFTAPEGIINEEQDLGNIVIKGNYKDICKETMTGAHVVVNAVSPMINAEVLVIKNDNTPTYDYYTTDAVATPDMPRLPAGTVDFIANTVNYSVQYHDVKQTITYYLTTSGLRINAADCTTVSRYSIVQNNAAVTGVYNTNGDTVIALNLDHQTPFKISGSPISFTSQGNGKYYVSSYAPEYIDITFDYLTGTQGLPQFGQGDLFSSAEWRRVTENGEEKYQLRLKLRKKGVYAGYTSSYDGNGNLRLIFSRYPSSIVGSVIVIDPGHGYNKSATVFDPGAVGHVLEQTINIAIAKKLTQSLQNAGATVYMLPTDTTYIDLYERSTYARRYDPDLFISVHCNSVNKGEGVRGVEAYYFTPYSQPLAALVSARMADYYKNSVYKDSKNHDRGSKYNYFAVTLEQQFPSILVECGFVTDSKEAMYLNDQSVQTGLANAMTQAVIEYFARN